MGESQAGGKQAIRWNREWNLGAAEVPFTPLLAVDSIEFLDHLFGEIDGVFAVDYNLDRLFAALIDNKGKPAFFGHDLRGR